MEKQQPKKPMFRLHKLVPEQLKAWQEARLQAGQAKYGDAHLQRCGPTDITEELIDAGNILALAIDRIEKSGIDINYHPYADRIIRALAEAFEAVCDFDEILPDELATDERGGERIWVRDEERRLQAEADSG